MAEIQHLMGERVESVGKQRAIERIPTRSELIEHLEGQY